MATLEAALLVPLIIVMICCLLFYTLQLFATVRDDLIVLQGESQTQARNPAAVIRNTDLFLSFFQEETP